MQVMQQGVPGLSGPLDPSDWRKLLPFEAAAASDRLGWVGLQAARYRRAPALEIHQPALTHHRLVLIARPPPQLDLVYEGVGRRGRADGEGRPSGPALLRRRQAADGVEDQEGAT
jgi:hypothetical protein